MRYCCLLLLVPLFLFGCTAPAGDPLAYQTYPAVFTLAGEVCGMNAELMVQMHAAGSATLTFSAPTELVGITFTIDALSPVGSSDAASVATADTTIPFAAPPAGIAAIVQALSLSEDYLSGVTRKGSDTLLTYTYPDGYVTVTTDASGTPSAFLVDFRDTLSRLSVVDIREVPA